MQNVTLFYALSHREAYIYNRNDFTVHSQHNHSLIPISVQSVNYEIIEFPVGSHGEFKHSPATLLGTPVQLPMQFSHQPIMWDQQMQKHHAIASQSLQLMFTSEYGKSVIVISVMTLWHDHWCQIGLSISLHADLLRFSHAAVSRV